MYSFLFFFFFNDTATTEIYTLSLHDALPTSRASPWTTAASRSGSRRRAKPWIRVSVSLDRKSTRLNSSHPSISYAVFCLKKKKKQYSYIICKKKKKKIQIRK